MNSESISSARLHIVPFSERHLTQRYLDWLHDDLVVQFSEQKYRQHSMDSCREYMESFAHGSDCFWAIEIKGEIPAHIGNITAYVDPVNHVADIGILVGDQTQTSKGYATEAWIAVCHYLLKKPDIRKVTGGTLSVNEPMLKLFARSGMRPDGVRRRQVLWNGTEVDIIHYCLFKEDLAS